MQGKDDDTLPEGWTKRESTSQPGRYYYVSPSGATQWYPPRKPTAPLPKAFNWRCEIEIEFGSGRLGVGLKEVPQTTSIPYPMFQAEVEELPKLPGGKPGPAEIYNWSVKPDKRLYPAMRLTQINGFVLAGCKYTEVVDKLKKADRPIKLKFADVSRGVYEKDEVPTEAITEAPKSSFSMQKQKKEEYMQLLVSSELSTEMWQLETQKIQSEHRQVMMKWDLLSKAFNALMEQQLKCKKDIEVATYEKAKFTEMLEQLKLQESGAVVAPEVLKMQELNAKNAELNQDINTMSAGNKKLRKEYEANQKLLDELEAKLTLAEQNALNDSASATQPKNTIDDLWGIDPQLSPRRKLELYRQKMASLEYELLKEEQRAKQAEAELAGLSRAYCEEADTMDTLRGSTTRPGSEATPSRQPMKSIEESAPAPTSMPPILMGSTRTGLHSQRSERIRSGSNNTSSLKRAESNRSFKSDVASNSSRSLTGSTRQTQTQPAVASAAPHFVAREGMLEKFPTHFNQEGGMFKSMRIMRGARERWCQLTPQGTLVYYKKRGDSTPRAEIPLNDASLEVICDAIANNYSGKSAKELTFTISTTLAQNKFQAATLEDLRAWVTAIRQVHAFWMSSGLEAQEDEELQRLVDEEQSRNQNRRAVEF